LIELLVEGDIDGFDLDEVTQEVVGLPKSDWQVPYDERVLQQSDAAIRYAFFFHYLDYRRQLLTPAGALPLPGPTSPPEYLKDIVYESPG